MTDDRNLLYTGVPYAAWGYFFLNFDFNLGTVSILPRFVGYFLLLTAIDRLSAERRDLILLRPLCLLLLAWSFADWLLSWFSRDLDGAVLFLDLLTGAAGLYFHFQFLTDMAALSEKLQPQNSTLDQRICKRRTLYIVLMTAISLVLYLPSTLAVQRQEWITGGLALAACIAGILIMTALFELRKYVRTVE